MIRNPDQEPGRQVTTPRFLRVNLRNLKRHKPGATKNGSNTIQSSVAQTYRNGCHPKPRANQAQPGRNKNLWRPPQCNLGDTLQNSTRQSNPAASPCTCHSRHAQPLTKGWGLKGRGVREMGGLEQGGEGTGVALNFVRIWDQASLEAEGGQGGQFQIQAVATATQRGYS